MRQRRLLCGALCLYERTSRLFQLTPQLADQQLLLTTQRHLALRVPRLHPPQILANATLTLTLTRHVLTLNHQLLPVLSVTQFLTDRSVSETPEFFVTWTRLTRLLILSQLLLLPSISCSRHHLTAEWLYAAIH